MSTEHFYHMFANGDDAKNFITSKSEFKAAFNRVGVCAYLSGAVVVAFSIEDSHPHILLYGTYEACHKFRMLYERMSLKSIVSRRGSLDGVNLHCELYEIDDQQYLMNVATYTVTQPTKDGKAVLPFDYLYGSGALYFRSKQVIMPWLINEDGEITQPVKFGSLTFRQKSEICRAREFVPDEWFVANGFILPSNFVDVALFESIYRTHNRYRVFLTSNRQRDEVIVSKMAETRGIVLEDLDARNIGKQVCITMFGKQTTRHLNTSQRLQLAQELRYKYRLSHRQISAITRIKESELFKYLR